MGTRSFRVGIKAQHIISYKLLFFLFVEAFLYTSFTLNNDH